jgi:outer membrane immunogenic protein
LAYGRIDENAALNSFLGVQGQFGAFGYTCGPSGNNCSVGGSSRTATGWTFGGGFEYVLSQNISPKAEYLYVNLGHGDTVNVVAQSTAGLIAIPSSFSATYSTVDFNLVRGGLNFRF